jgi:hypothetical protein
LKIHDREKQEEMLIDATIPQFNPLLNKDVVMDGLFPQWLEILV